MSQNGIRAVMMAMLLVCSGGMAQAAGTGTVSNKLATNTTSEMKEKAAVTLPGGEAVSINTATAQQLAAALNGVGLKKAESIVSYREQYGPFTAVEQLREVPGMGASLVERNLAKLKL